MKHPLAVSAWASGTPRFHWIETCGLFRSVLSNTVCYRTNRGVSPARPDLCAQERYVKKAEARGQGQLVAALHAYLLKDDKPHGHLLFQRAAMLTRMQLACAPLARLLPACTAPCVCRLPGCRCLADPGVCVKAGPSTWKLAAPHAPVWHTREGGAAVGHVSHFWQRWVAVVRSEDDLWVFGRFWESWETVAGHV